jgi:hypothetical protein
MTLFPIIGQVKLDTVAKKSNPIIFGDFNLGYSNGFLRGLSLGVSLNYQKNKNLFTFRNIETIRIDNADLLLGIIPINVDSKTLTEYALLYGRRYIDGGTSYHFSGGISYNTYKKVEDDITVENYSFIGFPLEFAISWFKSKKKKFRVLYGLIPVGKPTGFGRSFTLKLYSNISKNSYIGLGLNFGLGYHKKY